MRVIDGRLARKNLGDNKYGLWNRTSTDRLSRHAGDASVRIFDSIANVRPRYSGARLKFTDPVFAMGSCFARELERRLIKVGCNVCSLDESIERPEFADDQGRIQAGFLHRYTPASMLQEFRAAFGEQPGWTDDSLMFAARPSLLPFQQGQVYDLNYAFPPGMDYSAEASRTRRRVAHALVRKALKARIVILTLGLTKSWFHKASGLYLNAIRPRTLAEAPDDFELRITDAAGVETCLEEIYLMLRRLRGDDEFDLVVTVSPVPMSSTFTAQDVIVANMESKSALRAAAGAFAARRKRTHYFPSYEMALYSDPALVWRPDRLHVTKTMVGKIVSAFTRAYYEPAALSIIPEIDESDLGVEEAGGEEDIGLQLS